MDGLAMTVTDDGLVIGRSSERAQLALPDRSVASVHARITCEAGGCAVERIAPGAELSVDQNPVESRADLRNGTTLDVGDTTLVVYLPTVEGAKS
jgi:predicted component of type VI protein secretion system